MHGGCRAFPDTKIIAYRSSPVLSRRNPGGGVIGEVQKNALEAEHPGDVGAVGWEGKRFARSPPRLGIVAPY
jgi:hypothetical protein